MISSAVPPVDRSADVTTWRVQTSSLRRKVREVEGQGRAKFNFTAQTPMELSLIKGDRLTAAL
jgi:hypothetical protein